MAGAIIRGMAGGGFRGENIWVYDTDEDKLNALYEDCGITICPSGESVASGVDTLVLAVKPQVLPAVLPALSATLHRSRPLVISIAAGKTLASLEELLGEGLPLIRVMPNINAKVNESISAFCGNRLTEEGHKAVVRRIFEAVGEVIELEEKLFSAFSVIASCSPGVHAAVCGRAGPGGGTVRDPEAAGAENREPGGAGHHPVAPGDGEHPRALPIRSGSPGGTTIAGVCSLQKDAFEAAVVAAAQASLDRDKQL